MKKNRFTQEQIIAVLNEARSGVNLKELSRKYGVSEGTIYNWKAKYGDLTITEARRLKLLEEENSRLKPVVAVQTRRRRANF